MIKAVRIIVSLTATVGAMLAAQSVQAGSHTWRVNEVFSTPNGSVQFIELKESMGTPGEIGLTGLRITSVSTGHFFAFPGPLVPPSSNRNLLLATQSFANLPGAPTPNYIIPPNFFNQNGDTITYNLGIYDTWTFGAVPTDCVLSLNRTAFTPLNPGVVAANSPTNYAGATGQVDACPPIAGDLDDNGIVNSVDLGILLAAWTIPPQTVACGGARPCPADINHDGLVNSVDLGILLSHWTL